MWVYENVKSGKIRELVFYCIGQMWSFKYNSISYFYFQLINLALILQQIANHLIVIRIQRTPETRPLTGVVQSRGSRSFLFMLNITVSPKLMGWIQGLSLLTSLSLFLFLSLSYVVVYLKYPGYLILHLPCNYNFKELLNLRCFDRLNVFWIKNDHSSWLILLY